MRGWANLTDEEKMSAAAAFHEGISYEELHKRHRISKRCHDTFDRYAREGARWMTLLAQEPQAATEIDLDELQRIIKNHLTPISDLSKHFDRSTDTVQKALDVLKHGRHLNIVTHHNLVVLDTKNPPRFYGKLMSVYDQPAMDIKIAVASDIHAGSDQQQITALGSFLKTAYDEGARDVFVPGDVTAGNNMYRGQMHDLFALWSKPQVRVADYSLPRFPGLRYYVIGGNHDYSYVRDDGGDVVRELCDKRADMSDCGYDVGDVALTDNCIVRMWHPSGGVPYAKSYRLQKAMEQYSHDPRVKLVLAGHLHISLGPVKEGHMYGLQCGCFEGQTNYLRRKGLFPAVGGWIIDMSIREDGEISRIRTEWLEYETIENDYRNYPGIQRGEETEVVEPAYEWKVA